MCFWVSIIIINNIYYYRYIPGIYDIIIHVCTYTVEEYYTYYVDCIPQTAEEEEGEARTDGGKVRV